jgi:hypothetical protein
MEKCYNWPFLSKVISKAVVNYDFQNSFNHFNKMISSLRFNRLRNLDLDFSHCKMFESNHFDSILQVIRSCNIKMFQLRCDYSSVNLSSKNEIGNILNFFKEQNRKLNHKHSIGRVDFNSNILEFYFDLSEKDYNYLFQDLSKYNHNRFLFYRNQALLQTEFDTDFQINNVLVSMLI